MTTKDFGIRSVVRLHIDRLDRKDKAVWGVSMSKGVDARARKVGPSYTRAHRVTAWRSVATTVFRAGERQPKAWVEFTHVHVVRRVDASGHVEVELS